MKIEVGLGSRIWIDEENVMVRKWGLVLDYSG